MSLHNARDVQRFCLRKAKKHSSMRYAVVQSSPKSRDVDRLECWVRSYMMSKLTKKKPTWDKDQIQFCLYRRTPPECPKHPGSNFKVVREVKLDDYVLEKGIRSNLRPERLVPGCRGSLLKHDAQRTLRKACKARRKACAKLRFALVFSEEALGFQCWLKHPPGMAVPKAMSSTSLNVVIAKSKYQAACYYEYYLSPKPPRPRPPPPPPPQLCMPPKRPAPKTCPSPGLSGWNLLPCPLYPPKW